MIICGFSLFFYSLSLSLSLSFKKTKTKKNKFNNIYIKSDDLINTEIIK
jgi:hypothetical protein